MIRSDQIQKTVAMIQNENLDVRAVTMGINLLDCRDGDVEGTCRRVEAKIERYAESFVAVCNEVGNRYAVPVVNKRIAVTPIAHVGAGFDSAGFVQLALALDRAAAQVGVDLIGGFSANVDKGISGGARALIEALPEALCATRRVCASVNAGSTRHGINMDALTLLGRTVKDLAEGSRDSGGFAAAKFVVFTNQPDDNPFMAGAIHGLGDAEAVLNVGVSGPGVIARALERKIAAAGDEHLGLDDLAEEIKQAAFRVTRCGELIGRQVAKTLGLPFGVVDLSLAPTPKIADEMAIGMINSKTTAVRVIPVPGKQAGEFISFGGLFGESVIMPVRNVGRSARLIDFGGRIPAPIHSLKN